MPAEWRNSSDLWIECDVCGEGTSARVRGGVYNPVEPDEGNWQIITEPAMPSMTEPPGVGVVGVRCPAHRVSLQRATGEDNG